MRTKKRSLAKAKFISALLVSAFALSFGASAEYVKDKEQDKELKKLLTAMNWKTSISTNKDLIEKIDELYGRFTSDFVKKKHPFLSGNPKAKIDLKTLQWVNRVFFLKENMPGIIIYFPFGDLSLDEAKWLLFQIITGAFKPPYKKMFLIFKDKSVKSDFHHILNKNHLLINNAIQDATKDTHLTPEQINKIKKDILAHFGSKKHDLVGFHGLTTKITINIIGHGNIAKDSIGTTEASDTEVISYKEIVQDLIQLKIPDDTDINLMSCHSAQDTTVKFTKEEYMEKIKDGSLSSELLKNKSSFLNLFANEIYEKSQTYNGTVKGYFGEVVVHPHKNVYSLDKETNEFKVYDFIYGAQFKLADDNHVNFDRDILTFSLDRNNH